MSHSQRMRELLDKAIDLYGLSGVVSVPIAGISRRKVLT
jgi:hypothetical protein